MQKTKKNKQHLIYRNFHWVSFSIFVGFFFILGLQVWQERQYQTELINSRLASQLSRVEREWAATLENGRMLTETVGEHISNTGGASEAVFRLLSAYRTESYGFGWIDAKGLYTIGSQSGILNTPINVSDRPYIKYTFAHPDETYVGELIRGRYSKRDLIPVSRVVFNKENQRLGILATYIRLDALQRKAESVTAPAISITITDEEGIPALMVRASEKTEHSSFHISKQLGALPYTISISYDAAVAAQEINRVVASKAMMLAFVLLTVAGLMLVLRQHIVMPALHLMHEKEVAEEASRIKSEFIANMSHELRTPLNAIIGFSEVIMNQLHGPMQQAEYLDYAKDINHSGAHLLSLVNDILDTARLEKGEMELQVKSLDLTTIIESSIRLTKNMADKAKVRVFLAINSALPLLYADPKRLKQILLNVLSNAIKFTPEGGMVTVEATHDKEGGITLSIVDTGIGMKEEEIPLALAKFGQIDSVYARKHQGTGLGLPLAKHLTELHGGTFTLESHFGRGTVVTIRFPKECLREMTKPNLKLVSG